MITVCCSLLSLIKRFYTSLLSNDILLRSAMGSISTLSDLNGDLKPSIPTKPYSFWMETSTGQGTG